MLRRWLATDLARTRALIVSGVVVGVAVAGLQLLRYSVTTPTTAGFVLGTVSVLVLAAVGISGVIQMRALKRPQPVPLRLAPHAFEVSPSVARGWRAMSGLVLAGFVVGGSPLWLASSYERSPADIVLDVFGSV